MRWLPVAALLLLPQASWAGGGQDVVLSSMVDQNGQRVVSDIGRDYLQLVKELGIAVSNKPMAPGETLGAYGFDLSIANSFVFYTTETDDGSPSPWDRAVRDEDPDAYLFVPQISARKGLPFSFEIGGNAGWIGNSHQGIFGGYARCGLVEGYKPWPDISIHGGYSGYVGNDELELGTMDLGVTLGSTFAFGSFPGINNAKFAPYVDYSVLRVMAQPMLDDKTAEAVGAVPVSGRKSSGSYSKEMVVPELGGGFQVTNGNVLFRLVGTWAPGSIATATVGMGFTY